MTQAETAPPSPEQLDDLLHHFDIFDTAAQEVKWEIFAHARQACPVARTDGNGGLWLITRYEDVRRIMEDWETFSSLESPIVPTGVSLCPIDNDPPIQTSARQLLNSLFSRGALAKYEADMRKAAQDYIGAWVDRGSCEILNEYAGPYIGTILTKIIFDDMTGDELDHAQDLALRVAEGATPEMFAELFAMCADYFNRAKEKGSHEDGVVSRLINGTFEGRPITQDEAMGALSILTLGGLDTSRAAIGNITYRMATNPGVEDRLHDPGWVRRDFDEFLRLDSPVAAMARLVTKDVEIGGVQIKKGERVQVRFDSANRDETRFRNPTGLVFDEPRTGHAAFGFGVHRCIGSNMARMQIEIAFDELLKRIKNVRLAPGAHVKWVAGQSNALHEVPIEFDKVV